MRKDIKKFRNGIFNLNTRRFGSVSELFVKNAYGLIDSNISSCNLFDPEFNERVEVCASRALVPHKMSAKNSILTECFDASIKDRMIKYSNRYEKEFSCRFQQLKKGCFDLLVYVIFFKDVVVVYMAQSEELNKDIGVTNTQHRNSVNECQFSVNSFNIAKHDKNISAVFTYDEIFCYLSYGVEETENEAVKSK